MADLDTIKRLRISATSEGTDRVIDALERLGKAYKIVGDGAQAAAVQSDSAAKKLSAPATALDSILARLDPAEKAAQQFARSINAVARAAEGGYFAKFADGAQRLQSVVTGLQREYEKLGSKASGVNIAEAMGLTAANAQASARVYMDALRAELERRDPARTVAAAGEAQRRFNQAAGISDRLDRYSTGSARESAETFQRGFIEQAQREAKEEIARRAEADRVAAASQATINQRLGVAAPNRRAGEAAATFMEADAEAARKLSIEYDKLGTAIERRDTALAQANALLARGSIDAEKHAAITSGVLLTYEQTERALRGANTSLGKYATGVGLARHELVNFGRQAQDVFVSLAAGQPIMTVLIQQGTQIADIFATSKGSASGFFGQLLTGSARFATSIAGATAGVVAFGAAAAFAGYQYAESQQEVARSLIGIGRGSGQTVESINRIADAATNAGRISRASAREIASIFAGTGSIGSDLLSPGLVSTSTKGLANLTGKSQADAARDLAGALASPTQGAADLEKVLGRLSDAQINFIRNSEASGNKLEAQRALLATFNPQLAEAANSTGMLARAWNAVASGVSNAFDAIGNAITGQISLEERLAKAIERRRQMNGGQYGSGFLSSRARRVVGEADAEIADVQEQIRRRGALASERARDAASSNLSRTGGDILRGLFSDQGQLQDMKNSLAALETLTSDSSAMAKLGPLGRFAAEGVERLKSSIENFKTTNERIAQDNALQIQSINAYTLAERSAVEAERARVEAIRAGRGELQAGVEAEQARARAIAEANRQVRDIGRDARDAASLVGLSPFAAAQQQLRNQQQRQTETLSMGATGTDAVTALPQSAAVVRGLDQQFAENLQKLIKAVPGLTITSGFRTYADQARLYAEKGPGWAAPPGRSNHEKGLAADLAYNGSGRLPAWIHEKGREFGIGFPLANRARNPEAWHAEPLGARTRSGAVGPANNDNLSTAQALQRATQLREAYEGWNTPLANANRQLDAQIALQGRSQQTWLMSTAEITKAAETQRLLNEYMAQGIPITESLRQGIDAYATRAGQAAEEAKRFAEAQRGFREIGDTLKGSISGFISDIRNGVSGAEAFRNSLNKIADKLIDMALNDLFGKAFGNNSGGGLTSLFSSLFSGGFGGGNLGTTPGSGGLYSDGGYTGAGGKYQAAGIVHRGEVVWSQADVRRAGGVSVVEAMRRGIPGYADGGAAGYYAPMASAPAANSNGGGNVVNIYAPNAKVSKKQNSDGSVDVYVDQAEGQMARKVAQGRGPMAFAVKAQRDGSNLRG